MATRVYHCLVWQYEGRVGGIYGCSAQKAQAVRAKAAAEKLGVKRLAVVERASWPKHLKPNGYWYAGQQLAGTKKRRAAAKKRSK